MAHDVFLVAPPGLETLVQAEAIENGFTNAAVVPGGVTFTGSIADMWRANIVLRGPARVLMRIAEFRAMHLAQLDKRARKVDWGQFLRPDVPVHVEAVCRKSKIYHHKGAAQRISRAINETLGCEVSADAPIKLKVRIEDDLCTVSIDTSGDALHIRGHKTFTGKAPIRESLAALCLRASGFTGTEPVIDPMCGSGTLVLEAASIATHQIPGRSREFAFEHLANVDVDQINSLRQSKSAAIEHKFMGFDRDQGAIAGCKSNAEKSGLGDITEFTNQSISDLQRPNGPPGLIIVNPPYGGRIGNKKQLFSLYGSLGQTLKTRFAGWRVALITSEPGLAKATGLPWVDQMPPFPNGGIRVSLYHTKPLG
ncbi:MAG: THUMP domain-containing class I SAM-dependent RNA methyltransferase [Planktomarina sp.]